MKNRIIAAAFGALALIGLASSAQALPVSDPSMLLSWKGLYGSMSVGGGQYAYDDGSKHDLSGLVLEIGGGYRHQFMNGWVIGAELGGTLPLASGKEHQTYPIYDNNGNLTSGIETDTYHWRLGPQGFAGLTIGYAFGSLLVEGLAGGTFGTLANRYEYDYSTLYSSSWGQSDASMVGSYFGGRVNWAVTDSWTAGLTYKHVSADTTGYSGPGYHSTNRITGDTLSASVAYRF